MSTVETDDEVVGVKLTPEALESFEDVFLEWFEEGDNQERLEFGGKGDLNSLASKAFRWAVEFWFDSHHHDATK